MIELIDCARSNAIMKKHDFVICPMYLWYLNGQLVHMGGTFNGFSKAEEDFYEQVELCKKKGARGQYLTDSHQLGMSVKELSSI
jgi:hypothetical protein